ncbi:MAG: ferritin family protein [Syntrophobacteraceae bacterium]
MSTRAQNAKLMEMMCAALEIKEKMQALYDEAAGKCSDDVGIETFRMLREMEQEDLDRIGGIYKEMTKGQVDVDSCRFYNFHTADKKEVLKRIARERKFVGKTCLDDVAAIESGMELENKSITFFTDHLKLATSSIEREFLNYIIAEERSHYIILSDLRFYYVDPGHWLMEKGRTGLDGAGGIS